MAPETILIIGFVICVAIIVGGFVYRYTKTSTTRFRLDGCSYTVTRQERNGHIIARTKVCA